MNKEIKEILEDYNCIPRIKKIGDYITNLQQKNEDYKSKVKKTVEYFKYQLENLDFYEDTKARMLCAMGITLLQNGSDEE